MNKTLASLGSFGLGMGTMYLMDPVQAHRRQSVLRDKAMSLLRRGGDLLDKGVRDMTHRVVGSLAELRSILPSGQSPDAVLVARIRSKIGRAVSHPHAIRVIVCDGHVALDGHVLVAEAGSLLHSVSHVHGVRSVQQQLQVHRTPEDIPSLQGSATLKQRQQRARENWPPAFRLLASAAGTASLVYGLRRGGPVGAAADLAGGWLLLRGFTNLPQKRLVGLRAGRRAIDLHKTINIRAPLEDVFDLWSRFDQFPRFMAHVREVRDLGYGRTHWVVSGPAGVSVEWDAVITRMVPGRLIAWKTEGSSAVEHAGIIRFDPNPDGSSRIDIRLSYNPVAGAVGHLVATLFGQDPKHAMDDDLARVKSLLETGKARGHERVSREEVVAHVPSEPPTTLIIEVQP